LSKRGNGEGTISRRKNGGWVAQYYVYTAKGRKRKTLYGKTRAEAARRLARALSDRENGLTFDAGKITLGEYLDRWLRDSVRGTVRLSTFERHEQIVRLHVSPVLGRVRLKNLTPPHVRRLIAEKLESGLAPATVRKIHSTLHKALSGAVSDGLIPRNAADVKAPRPTPKEMRPLSEDEARTFLEATRGDHFEALYVLAITTGLRRGELLGLKWDGVDLDRGTLRRGRALVREGGRHAVGETKIRRGRRQVNLTPRTVKALRTHRKRDG
jgi:integrase